MRILDTFFKKIFTNPYYFLQLLSKIYRIVKKKGNCIENNMNLCSDMQMSANKLLHIVNDFVLFLIYDKFSVLFTMQYVFNNNCSTWIEFDMKSVQF